MNKDEIQHFSLTGENSHSCKIESGQGSFSIGPVGAKQGRFDALVEPDATINWHTFDGCRVPAEYHWPRYFYYHGSDTGFGTWSENRRIERFSWFPQHPVSADLTHAKISELEIELSDHVVQLKLGTETYRLAAHGKIENLTIHGSASVDYLRFYPTLTNEPNTPYQLPNFPALKNVESISVDIDPNGQPFDCKSLKPFSRLTDISLHGNLTNLDFLTNFEYLESLRIETAPNLAGFPSLRDLPKLKSFIALNVEENAGKTLRKELNVLKKERKMEYSIVQKLRKSIWYSTEYGTPFSLWEGKMEKVAVKVFKNTIQKLKRATTEKEVKAIIIEFSKFFNGMAGIETLQREDIGDAVIKLVQIPDISISPDEADKWFDAARDY